MTSTPHLPATPHLVATSLDQRITDYATLIALVLVLITLFTTQRATRLDTVEKDTNRTRAQATQEIWLDGALAAITLLIFATGAPLLWDSITALNLGGNSGPLRSGFAITWVLLVVLIGWQVMLFRRAHKVRDLIDHPGAGQVGNP